METRALLVAEKGVVCKSSRWVIRMVADSLLAVFRKQHTLSIEQQRDLGAYFGPLHRHATYAVPKRGDLDDVVGESNCSTTFSSSQLTKFILVVYSDKNSRPDLYAFSRAELFHSDVTYEVQPPGATILRLLTTPEVGNDTLWSSGYVPSTLVTLRLFHAIAYSSLSSASCGLHAVPRCKRSILILA
jgi:alpha-ketoglutarate-dependent taurine dioxygenase